MPTCEFVYKLGQLKDYLEYFNCGIGKGVFVMINMPSCFLPCSLVFLLPLFTYSFHIP